MVEVQSPIFLLVASCLKLQLLRTVSVTVWHGTYFCMSHVQLSSCVMLGASVTAWYRRHGGVKNFVAGQ